MNTVGEPRIIVAENPEEAAARAVGIIVGVAGESVARSGRFVAAISGGSTPTRMHRMLVAPPCVDLVPWEKTHLFWTDERCVPPSHPESNFGGAWRDFLRDAPIPERNIHPMPGEVPPEEAAARCQSELMGFFQLQRGEYPRFDLICLGMGKDGHTASLFPGHEALREARRLVMPVRGGIPDLHRLTMTLPVLNQGRTVLFLVTGRAKAEGVKAALDGVGPLVPAAMVQPVSGNLVWLLDREAASLLGKEESPR